MASGAYLEETALQRVAVDIAACRGLSTLIRSRDIPADHEDSSLDGLRPKEIGNFYLLLVAICHQTSPRGKPPLEGKVGERYFRGWDFLSAKLEAAVRENPNILSPAYWARITGDGLRELFRDKTLGDRLSDPLGRALLIADLGAKMLERGWMWADDLCAEAKRCVASGPNNLVKLLSFFRAYDDPVHKKTFFFLALMQNSGLWVYADSDKLGAPVDYHEVRGHLRIGTVKIHDEELRAKLLSGHKVSAEEDVLIRDAVHKALMFISDCSGVHNSSQLHYLFWNVFRSCCTRDNPHCNSCPSSCPLPERYVSLALFPDGARRCPFSTVCQSVGNGLSWPNTISRPTIIRLQLWIVSGRMQAVWSRHSDMSS